MQVCASNTLCYTVVSQLHTKYAGLCKHLLHVWIGSEVYQLGVYVSSPMPGGDRVSWHLVDQRGSGIEVFVRA